MSISIHELLAVARESEGVKAVKGDAMLCEKRFAPSTRYMVEFLLLEQSEQFGNKGELWLTMFSYEGIVPRADRAAKCRSFALSEAGSCAGRNTSLSSCPDRLSGQGIKNLTGWKEKIPTGTNFKLWEVLSPEIFLQNNRRREW